MKHFQSEKKNVRVSIHVIINILSFFFAHNRDVLPFTLKLPYAISTAKTESQLEELAQLGLSKWVPMHRSVLK